MLLCFLLLLAAAGCGAKEEIPAISDSSQTGDDTQQRELEWTEISPEGLDEEKLIENIDESVLEEVAALLQQLTGEIEAKQREDPEFAMSAGWFTYTLESDQYRAVVQMGDRAAKPLYLILYKSPDQGLFEYICAMALSEITGCTQQDWKTSKEFLTVLNTYLLEHQ